MLLLPYVKANIWWQCFLQDLNATQHFYSYIQAGELWTTTVCINFFSTKTQELCTKASKNVAPIRVSWSVSKAADVCVWGSSVLFSLSSLSALTTRHSLPLWTISRGCFYGILWVMVILIMYFHVGAQRNTHTHTCAHMQSHSHSALQCLNTEPHH